MKEKKTLYILFENNFPLGYRLGGIEFIGKANKILYVIAL